MTEITSTLGITLGDVTGIGPEVAFKALARQVAVDESTRYVVIGDRAVTRHYCGLLGLTGDLVPWEQRDEVQSRLYLLDTEPAGLPVDLPPGHPDAAMAALRWLREGTERCLAGELQGLVTGPVSKESILRSGQAFVGQTEYLGRLCATDRFAMMLLGQDDRGRWLRVMLASTHVPLRSVAETLTPEGLGQTLELADQAARELGLERRRIGVCGLNPHAGEGGRMGREEVELIGPAVEAARNHGIDCRGPWPADTLFARAYAQEYEVVVAMYHDQGLVPLKMVAFATGVNWTVGLPFVRTSPDHGTAFDIAGRGLADPRSMESAIGMARNLIASQAAGRAAGGLAVSASNHLHTRAQVG